IIGGRTLTDFNGDFQSDMDVLPGMNFFDDTTDSEQSDEFYADFDDDLFDEDLDDDMDDDLDEDDYDLGEMSSSDTVGLYLKEMARVPLLNTEEEIDLAKRLEAGL